MCCIVRYALVWGFAMLSGIQITQASASLYRCPDGTFTNRVERQCHPYEAKGIVRVQGETPEASKQPFAEVKLFNEPAKRTDK